MAAVQLNETPHECKAETEAALRAMQVLLALNKELENTGQQLTRDAAAIVGDAKHRLRCFLSHADADRSTRGRELERVVEQIGINLLQPRAVAPDPDGSRINSDRRASA